MDDYDSNDEVTAGRLERDRDPGFDERPSRSEFVPVWLVEEAERDMCRADELSWALEIPFRPNLRRR